MTEAQIQRLEGIGMVWEPLTDQWQEMYQHAKAYYQVHQMLNVPCNYSTETGVRLGHWIARQRRCYKNFLAGKEGQGIGTITPERIAQLNELGMIWDGTQATAKTSFREKALLFYLKKPFPDVVKVSQWQVVGVELDLYIPSLRIAIEYDGYQWHHNKLALDERKGEICRRFGIRLIRIREPGLPQASRCERVIVLDDSGEAAFAEAICTLFRWLNLPDPAPDIARDRPAILETYRDVTARAWDQSYQAVYRYHRRHGTLSIPADLTSPSGVNLAGWLHSQREAYRSNELTALQIQKLEALGMQWAPFEARWQRMYQLAAAYAQRHGDLRIPHDYVTEEHVRLGSSGSRRHRTDGRRCSPWPVPIIRTTDIFALGSVMSPRTDVHWDDGLPSSAGNFAEVPGRGCARHRNTKNTGWTRSEWYGTRIGNDGGRNTRWQRPTTRPMAI